MDCEKNSKIVPVNELHCIALHPRSYTFFLFLFSHPSPPEMVFFQWFTSLWLLSIFFLSFYLRSTFLISSSSLAHHFSLIFRSHSFISTIPPWSTNDDCAHCAPRTRLRSSIIQIPLPHFDSLIFRAKNQVLWLILKSINPSSS